MRLFKIIIIVFISITSSIALAAAYLEISIENEIDMKDGSYIAKEYGGQGRYALINHSHGRFSGGDIANAECSDGYVVSKLPSKFSKISKFLKQTDFVLTNCQEGL